MVLAMVAYPYGGEGLGRRSRSGGWREVAGAIPGGTGAGGGGLWRGAVVILPALLCCCSALVHAAPFAGLTGDCYGALNEVVEGVVLVLVVGAGVLVGRMSAADWRGLDRRRCCRWRGLGHLLGELPGAVHPVVWMGKVARAGERRAPSLRGREFVYGAALALLPPVGLCAGGAAWLARLRRWPTLALAGRGAAAEEHLRDSGSCGGRARRCGGPLAGGRSRGGAREGLRSLVSRDARALDAGAAWRRRRWSRWPKTRRLGRRAALLLCARWVAGRAWPIGRRTRSTR